MNTTEKVNVEELLSRTGKLIKEGKDFLVNEGKVLELGEWLNITEYAKKYNLTTQVISKWIERGIIPDVDYIEVGKFGKRLVRDIPYKQ